MQMDSRPSHPRILRGRGCDEREFLLPGLLGLTSFLALLAKLSYDKLCFYPATVAIAAIDATAAIAAIVALAWLPWFDELPCVA